MPTVPLTTPRLSPPPTGSSPIQWRWALDGFPRIAYSDGGQQASGDSALHFIQCSDDDCASAGVTYVDDGSDDGIASIAVGSDGTSNIVYDDGNDKYTPESEYNQGVGLATCTGGEPAPPPRLLP